MKSVVVICYDACYLLRLSHSEDVLISLNSEDLVITRNSDDFIRKVVIDTICSCDGYDVSYSMSILKVYQNDWR